MPTLFIPREHADGEARVSGTPESVAKLKKLGFEVQVERGAGSRAHFTDEAYEAAGAALVDGPDPWRTADVVLTVSPLAEHPDLGPLREALREGAAVAGFLSPLTDLDTLRTLRDRRITAVALELLPRISRAQSMDALSSQANIGGYKAALLVASHLDRYMPLLMTAAGTVKPARVVVMGAGVAGLQALATAKRLGAVVEVSDIRPEVQEQVESLGGRFIDLPELGDGSGTGGYAKAVTPEFLRKQREIVSERVKAADAVITTALVPGRKAPVLVTEEMVRSMRPGAVIVDMAVAAGGNCELSELGQVVERHGVKIVGDPNLPASVPHDASALYASNLVNLLTHLTKDGGLHLDFDDEITSGVLAAHDGKVVSARAAEALERAEEAA